MSYDDKKDDRYRGSRGAAKSDPRYNDGYANDDYDDYDDYDEIDDDYPDPAQPGSHVGDAETLLRRAIDIIATAPTMPLSSSPRIDRDEIIELLDEALAPPARGVAPGAVDAQGAPGVRRQDAARGRRAARGGSRAGRADGAAHRGRPRRRAAGATGHRDRRQPTRAGCATRPRTSSTSASASFEILLDKLQKTVAAGRQRLSIGATRARRSTAIDDEDPTKGFFDQDR